MSADIMPCGCEGHADNADLCRYPALQAKLEVLKAEVERLEREKRNTDREANLCIEAAHDADARAEALRAERDALKAEVKRLQKELESEQKVASRTVVVAAEPSRFAAQVKPVLEAIRSVYAVGDDWKSRYAALVASTSQCTAELLDELYAAMGGGDFAQEAYLALDKVQVYKRQEAVLRARVAELEGALVLVDEALKRWRSGKPMNSAGIDRDANAAIRAALAGKDAKPICDTCNDTHQMPFGPEGHEREVPCTRCPTPCAECGGGAAYCRTTPCPCRCHRLAGKEGG